MKRAHPDKERAADAPGTGAFAASLEQRLGESECASLAAALISEMGQWFDSGEGLPHRLASAFVASDGCERAVLDMLLGVRLSAPAAKVPVALRAIRINFGDAVASYVEREESLRDDDWQRACVLRHFRVWTDVMPQLSPIYAYKLNNLYPNLPDSWKRSLLFTEEATYSVTPSPASQVLCHRILERGGSSHATIVDAFACVGGDTANFTRQFRHVHSIELDHLKIPLLRHNLRVCLACPFRPDEVVEPPSAMLSLPANLQIHLGDCRAVIPTLQLVSLTLKAIRCFGFTFCAGQERHRVHGSPVGLVSQWTRAPQCRNKAFTQCQQAAMIIKCPTVFELNLEVH